MEATKVENQYFYPRSPCGERPVSSTPRMDRRYFYPRSPCGERRIRAYQRHFPPDISIHALLAESDQSQKPVYDHRPHFYPRSPCGERRRIPQNQLSANGISIHALLAESDWYMSLADWQASLFLSTLSLRRATACIGGIVDNVGFLSTLSLRRATLRPLWCSRRRGISIHALLAESDVSLNLIGQM